ncbi:hypothetical protein O181_002421 [Austropuccinia psidii MF-1]|uniref:Uncharacterized protein n=1 Tax=Austropuccinia psidii MF-1 TaxID=1389203 RepID=A0A9Q3BBW5_9BASI|nr:hypothetical protein [Austropuccinia psidii MF-1]
MKSSVDSELGTFDKELKKLTSNINDLRNNDRTFTEWCKVTNSRIESISITFDRFEREIRVINVQLETHVDEQLTVFEIHVVKIVYNKILFATHLARSDSERKKLKNESISHAEKIHKNSSHMPRHSTLLTEEKPFLKEILTPFLGENAIPAKDIPKLEDWPTFSGEVEYNHIEFIRKIDILQEDFHIPNEMKLGKLCSLFTRISKKWY